LLFKDKENEYRDMWKNWQSRLSSKRWSTLRDLVASAVESATGAERLILENLHQLLAGWPEEEELELLVKWALDRGDQESVNSLLLAVEQLKKFQTSLVLQLSNNLDQENDHLKATEEGLKEQWDRPQPKASAIVKLEGEKKKFAETRAYWAAERERATRYYEYITIQHQKLNDHMLSLLKNAMG